MKSIPSPRPSSASALAVLILLTPASLLASAGREGAAAAPGGLPSGSPEARAAVPPGIERLRALAHDYYQWQVEDQPVWATDQGRHAGDDRIADLSPPAIRQRYTKAKMLLAQVLDLDHTGFTRDDEIEWALFRSDLEGTIFAGDVLRAESRDPGLYVGECSNAIFSLLKKDYAPRAARARAATARLRAMPALLEEARSNLTQPVALLARLAAESAESIGPLFNVSLMTLAEDIPTRDRHDLESARDRALAALKEFAAWLRDRQPSMTAPLAMGRAAYDRMLSRVHLLPFDADFVASIGQVELARAKALESWLPDPNLAEVRAGGGSSLPSNEDEFLRRYESRLDDLIAHLKKRDLLTIPSYVGPFRIRELPAAFKPTSPGGFMNPPGVFDEDPVGFFFIPTYDPNSPNFYIRAAIQDPRPILGHEGIPGHFLQLSIANHIANEIRRMHDEGVLVEGWALYGEEMLQRTGLYADSPGAFAQVLRLMRYRAARVTVDVKLHTGEWTFDQAVDYFMKEGGLDREAATGEAAGAAATPGQKITYMVGKWQIERLLGRYRDAKGASFTLKSFHDALLAQGSIPLSLAEWALLDDDTSYRQALKLAEAGTR